MRALLLLIPFLLMACDQDPLKDQPDHIKNATPPDLKPVEELIFCPPDAMVLESFPRIANFKESQRSEVKLVGRAACGQNYEAKIEIVELPVNSSFDSATGTFSWEPPEGFVSGSNYSVEYLLPVTIRVPELSISQTKQINLNVFKNDPAIPEITSIDNVVGVSESGSTYLKVTVRDIDASINDLPGINFLPAPEAVGRDASAFVKLREYSYKTNPYRSTVDPTLWIFDLAIDLRGTEVTTSETKMAFVVRSVSPFGVSSPDKTVDFMVTTDVSYPKYSIADASRFSVVEGQRSIVHFQVYSPGGDGQLTVEFTRLPPQAKAECTDANTAKTVKNCYVDWVPQVGGILSRPPEFHVTTTNKHFKAPVGDRRTLLRGIFDVVRAN